MRSEDLSVDVTGEVALQGRLVVAATVHRPDDDVPPPVVVVAMPGGGYNRPQRMWHSLR